MSFLQRLRRAYSAHKNAVTRNAVLYYVDDTTGDMVPVQPGQLGGGSVPSVSLARTSLALTGAALPLPFVPAGATGARLAVEGGAARTATATPDPTPTDGELWADGSVWLVEGRTDLLAFRAVTVSGAPTLRVTYLGPQA